MNRETDNILGDLERESYSFQISRDEYRRGMCYGNGDHKADGSMLEKLEEMQKLSIVRQKDASETERGRSTKQWPGQHSYIWDGNAGYNKETRKTN